MTTASIVNVTGYAGSELARLLATHAYVKLVSVTGRSAAGKRLSEVFPHLAAIDMVIEADPSPADVVFSALPQTASAAVCIEQLDAGAKVIDISADFRLADVKEYETWYQAEHPNPKLCSEAVYGLTELHRSQLRGARLVANPGCYPTASILALAPAMGFVVPSVIVDAKSGVSGGGRSLTLANHYSEVNENVQAYALGGHRHLPEIMQELSRAAGTSVKVTFLPHLVPMTRGILATCYADLTEDLTTAQVAERYGEFYRDEPFVKVVSAPPQTKQAWGSNLCLIYPVVDKRTGRLIVVSCIDNLVKGAAGQAIQNMNLMFGFPETTALTGLPVYP